MLHGTRVYQARVFKTRFTKQTRVSKKWYIATYFANSGMLQIISVKSGKWPIWPKIMTSKNEITIKTLALFTISIVFIYNLWR